MRRLLVLLMLLALAVTAAPVVAQSSTARQAADRGVAWISTQQLADGSFSGFDAGSTVDAIFALAAAGRPVPATAVSYLESQAASYAGKSTGAAAKLLLAVVAVGGDPASFAGQNLLSLVQAGYNSSSGQFGTDIFGHSLALLAHAAAGITPPAQSISALKAAQLSDGGWSFDGSAATGSDTNTTALAIQALLAVDPGAQDSVSRAVSYLQTQQNSDGGFPYSKASSFGSDSDANSTGVVLQALTAAGADTTTALQGLLALQNPSGAFRYQAAVPDDNALATYQAIPGLLGVALPVPPTSVVGATLPGTAGLRLPLAALLISGLFLFGLGVALRRRAAV